MRKATTLVRLAVAASLLLGVGAPALADDDADFVKKAANGGMMEVELGRHAAKNAASAEVRAFGQRMVADHSAANRELEGIARRTGLAVPAQMDEKHREMAQHLTALRGAEFDRAYMKEMVKDHDDVVGAFKEQADQGKSEVDRWAARTLPTIQAHLAQAKTVSEHVDAAETGSGATSREEGNDPRHPSAGPDPIRTPDRP